MIELKKIPARDGCQCGGGISPRQWRDHWHGRFGFYAGSWITAALWRACIFAGLALGAIGMTARYAFIQSF